MLPDKITHYNLQLMCDFSDMCISVGIGLASSSLKSMF